MAILHSCCCWSNVRNGSIACGVYTLILSLAAGGLTAYNLISLQEMETDLEEHTSLQLLSPHITSARYWHYGMALEELLLFSSSILLIIAIHMERSCLLLPWIFVTVLVVVTDTAVLIFQCVTFGLITFNVVLLIIWLCLTLLNVYCLLCVISQYQELRAGRGTLEYLQQQRMTIIYRPAVQELHITQGPVVLSNPYSMAPAEPGGLLEPMLPPSYTTAPPPSYPVYTTAAAMGPPSSQDPTGCVNRSDKVKQESPPPPYIP